MKRWSLPVHDPKSDQADLAIYAQLYSLTVSIAEPIVHAQLTSVTAEAGAQLAVDDLKVFQQFLESDSALSSEEDNGNEGGSEEQSKSTSEFVQFMRAGLATYLEQDDRTNSMQLSKEVSEELAAGIWSSLLGGLEHSGVEKKIPASVVVPSRSGARDGQARLDLGADLVHLAMPEAVLINIVHQAMHRLMGMHAKNQDYVQLPMRLRLSKDEVFRFLESQYPPADDLSPEDRRIGSVAKAEQLGERIRAALSSLPS